MERREFKQFIEQASGLSGRQRLHLARALIDSLRQDQSGALIVVRPEAG